MVKIGRFFKACLVTVALTLVLAIPVQALHLPDLKAGFCYNYRQRCIAPSLTVELFERNRWCLDFGLTVDVLFLSLGFNLVEIVEIAPIIFWGYNVNTQSWTWGFGLTWIKW